MKRRHLYILEEKQIRVADDVFEWSTFFKNPNRVLKQDKIGDIQVSTVFLGMDHSFSIDENAPPVLFETMIFGGKYDQYQERYSSYDSALEGHERALKMNTKQNKKSL